MFFKSQEELAYKAIMGDAFALVIHVIFKSQEGLAHKAIMASCPC